MNANQIARLMFIITQSFLRQEIKTAEYTDLVEGLVAQARSAGIGEEARAAYDRMCEARYARNEAA